MAANRVLKLARTDDDVSWVLLHVIPIGSKPLDVKLEATEGEARYAATLKHDQVASLRIKNSSVSEKEWQDVLVSLFNQQPLGDIQAAATVQSESSLSITIRKQVQGITQRLGEVVLSYDMSDDIQLFDWCAISAEAAANSKEEASASSTKIHSLEFTITQLKQQLQELVQAKEEDETALLHKFRDLLNEKKVKIREQQKILASAAFSKTSPSSPPPQSPKQQSLPTRHPAKSRNSKRKATIADAGEDSSGGGAKDVDMDKVKEEPEDSDAGQTTEATASAASDDSDDDGDNSDDRIANIPSSSTAQHLTQPKASSAKTVNEPPQRRDLPFTKRKPASIPRAPAASGADEETDSDDEL